MKNSGPIRFFLCFLVMLIAACAASPGKRPGEVPLSIETILTSQICLPAAQDWTATWISSRDGLQEMFSRARSNQIGGPSQEPPAIDFDRNGVLVVEMGKQPTAGYGFDTEAVTISLTGDTAVVTLPHRRPAPGAVTAQMVTSPCILLRLTRGAYGLVRVVDQSGRMLSEVTVPYS